MVVGFMVKVEVLSDDASLDTVVRGDEDVVGEVVVDGDVGTEGDAEETIVDGMEVDDDDGVEDLDR